MQSNALSDDPYQETFYIRKAWTIKSHAFSSDITFLWLGVIDYIPTVQISIA